MASYEAHITMDKVHAPVVNPIIPGTEACPIHTQLVADWYYSAIDDDPIMGQKPYCYLTGWDSNPENLLYRMNRVVTILKENYSVLVLRTKIERIIFDSKTGVNDVQEEMENE